jgi:alpha-D-ribose 1-methylphosphonate 5-triphosphate diphosphatase
MKHSLLITNGQVVLPDRVIVPGEVLIEDGVIIFAGRQFERHGMTAKKILDAGGGYILPGLIDLHSDAIEKELEPRPGAIFAPEMVFGELEKRLAGNGITTMYHSFSMAGAEWGIRNDGHAADCIRRIVDMFSKVWLIRNRVHLRFEITNVRGVETIRSLIDDGMIDLLSFMDHTPGQGQYPTIEDYRRYMEKTYHLPYSRIEENIAAKEQGRPQAPSNIEQLSAAARDNGVPMASHDDDDIERLAAYRNCGVTIHEFPISLAVAEAGRRLGSHVCVGAPNVVRDGSTGKGMRAREAIAAGAANIICSDYHPPSMLQAVFKLSKEVMALPRAVRLASLEPARAVGLKLLGSLEAGCLGDAILVSLREGVPIVTDTVVGGVQVYRISYCNHSIRSQEQGARAHMPRILSSTSSASSASGLSPARTECGELGLTPGLKECGALGLSPA